MRVAMIGLVVVAACAPPAVAVAPQPIGHAPVPQDAARPSMFDGPRRLVFRRVGVGTHQPTMTRMTSVLAIDGTTATLTETEEEAPGPFTIERADHDAKWTAMGTHTQTGPVRHEGDHVVLELASDVDSLYLHCWQRTLEVAPPGAHRIPSPGRTADCDDPGVWTPATTRRIAALVCGQEDAGDESDLETHREFAGAPGIEHVFENNDCHLGDGLRLAR